MCNNIYIRFHLHLLDNFKMSILKVDSYFIENFKSEYGRVKSFTKSTSLIFNKNLTNIFEDHRITHPVNKFSHIQSALKKILGYFKF